MKSALPIPPLRVTGVALAIGSALLLGCAYKLNIQVPSNYHGRVTVLCTGDMDDGAMNLHIDNTGVLRGRGCPSRQTDAVVTRDNGKPVDVSVMWMTTGDGFVREIHFDVP